MKYKKTFGCICGGLLLAAFLYRYLLKTAKNDAAL